MLYKTHSAQCNGDFQRRIGVVWHWPLRHGRRWQGARVCLTCQAIPAKDVVLDVQLFCS